MFKSDRSGRAAVGAVDRVCQEEAGDSNPGVEVVTCKPPEVAIPVRSAHNVELPFDPREWGAEPDVTWGLGGIDSLEPEGV